ncbi:class II aaRS and biotin synthetase [Calocera viscosa TUFC12733]|uniref:Class II aaRS and biotin synthetase n=1 Tax=Calocera viscosa (strain TUFC12733) TaxID=1330018 RepID=A0A167KK52_CALVF|nr:class II aaRS and biotin synthetase [Calocera viscosa TUFC12733]
MNVLVYSGPGVSTASLTHTLSSLRTALSPAYAVQPVLPAALASEPWAPTCALLVIPGGRDLPYVTALAPAISKIKAYVHGGGRFLGICAGAYFASERCEFEQGSRLEVVGGRELGFFPGTCEGCTFPGFEYESEAGARAVDLTLSLPAWGEHGKQLEEEVKGVYYNGGGHFLPSPGVISSGQVTVLARYAHPPEEGKDIAAVLCRVGAGLALLSSPHIEYPLLSEPARSALDKRLPNLTSEERTILEQARTRLVLAGMRLLGLSSPSGASNQPTTPLPQLLVSSPSRPELAILIFDTLGGLAVPLSSPPEIRDANDVFQLHPASAAPNLISEARARVGDSDSAERPKMILGYIGALPGREVAPLFDLEAYFEELERVRGEMGLAGGEEWGMGQVMFYGEVVTSTQTMLDRNPTLLSTLPTPFLSLATHQLTGRGRGSNIWLSPSGCLQFSLHLRPPASLKPAKLVFIQYLFGLAVVRACRAVLTELGGERAAEKVRLKWPNDVYGIVERGERRKLGGILVGTNHLKGRFEVVIGCGLNVLNTQPTTSLKHLLSLSGSPRVADLTLEKVLAHILPTFDAAWTTFLAHRGDFRPFEQEYLAAWLHSDQVVRLTTVAPPIDVRIVGITLDYGLLRTVPAERDAWKRRLMASEGEEYIDLQPDGNSFDMTEGLIKKKT